MRKFLFFITCFLFIFALAVIHNTIDMDFWARIVQGNAFWQLGSILKFDPFSYTKTHLWLDHEWGSSVIFSFILKYFGYKGIILFRSFLVFGIFFFIFKTIEIRYEKTNELLNIIYFITAALAMPTLTTSCLRCHFFTFFLFTLSLFLLEYVRKKERYKLLIFFPFIMMFWVNVHGGCVSLLGLLFMYALGEYINKKAYKYYIYTLIACIAFMFINPYGIEYVKFIFMATTMKRPFVTEWISPFAHPVWTFFIEFKILYIIYLLILIFTVKKFKEDAVKYIVLIVCAYLSFKYVKNTPFFIITATIFLYPNIKFNSKILYYIFAAVILSYSLFIISTKKIVPNLSMQPYKVVEFIKVNNMKGNILAPFDMGSYITYKLFPNNLIYMDGRYEEVYFNETKQLLDNFFNVTQNWDEILNIGLNHDYIITPRNAVVNDYLAKKEDYKYIYADEYNCLFVKKDKLKRRYILPDRTSEYYINNAFSTDILFVVK